MSGDALVLLRQPECLEAQFLVQWLAGRRCVQECDPFSSLFEQQLHELAPDAVSLLFWRHDNHPE